MSEERCCLVLGYPGVPAARFVRDLVEKGNSRVRVLCAGDDLAMARKWAKDLGEAVEIIQGDSEKIDFGLSGDEYRGLAAQITSIFCLIPPEPYDDERKSKAAKVVGREVIELAMCCARLSRVVVLSDLDVAGNGGKHSVFSEVDDGSGKGFPSEGAKFRFEAERVYRRFAEELPITLVRTGLIFGEGELGLSPLAHLLFSCPEGSLEGVKPFPLTDMESLATLLSALERAPEEISPFALHCFSGDGGPLSEIQSRLFSMAQSQVPAGFDLAAGARRVLSQKKGGRSWSHKDLLKRCEKDTVFDQRRTTMILEELGLAPPKLHRRALERLADIAVEEIVGFR